MRVLVPVFLPIFTILFFLGEMKAGSSSSKSPSRGSKATQNQAEGKKQGGISGDPAHKRGLTLGFDAGLTAAREDQAQGKKPNPSSHSEYQDPEKKYRYEYGSRAGFISGFRSGFLGGYKSLFGKEVKTEERETVSEGSKKSTAQAHPQAGGAKSSRPKNSSYNPASDAL